MNILVFGAGGQVGRRLCTYADSDGHHVTAFVRDADSAPQTTAVVEGDATDRSAVADAVADHDAVCSALGPRLEDDPAVLSTAVGTIVDSMEAAGVDRLVAVAAAGILQATPTRLRLETAVFPERLQTLAAAHREVHDRLRSSTLSWTLVCPPRIPDGAPTNHYRTAVDYLPEGGQSISSGDVAAFVSDTVAGETYHRERVGIAY